MAPQQTLESPNPAGPGERATLPGELSNLEIWAHSVPIRLAGYEEEQLEPHIFRGLD